ncbi:MAG TPA: pentapeptide repeat-containing protein [Pirellulaceae bacterium]|nr:pentapeptide repeat-containing protein [Pirellulaceae bacterium]
MTLLDPASCFRALVRPRAIAPDSGEVLPLEDLAAELLQPRSRRLIEISGGPGAGKTTALRHLAATLPAAADAVFLDDAQAEEIGVYAGQRNVFFASRETERSDIVLRLAPWGDDDLIEWLLAAAPQRCGDVMARLHAAADKEVLRGNPTLWHVALDQFLDDASLSTIRGAVVAWLAKLLKLPKERRLAADFSLAILLRDPVEALRAFERLCPDHVPRDRYRPLRHAFVQQLLAAQRLANLIRSGGSCPALHASLPLPLIEELALWVRSDPAVGEALRSIMKSDRSRDHAQAATILFAADPAWRPDERQVAHLSGGAFPGAQWAGLRLPSQASQSSDLSETNLTSASLTQAVLDGASLRKSVLARARLDKASLALADAHQTDLSGANLTAANASYMLLSWANLQGALCDDATLTGVNLEGADLRGARFRGANLERVVLRSCQVEGTDFQGANLRGASLPSLVLREAELQNACFEKADLSHCDLEGVSLPSANFFHATLTGAYLTGSRMPAADFRRASLCGAGLADIHWEGADLRGADLRGCTFHMGSSRSGLVGSPYPGHGSKTGFYTDDYNDQDFKAPEEIRKANLCGADLRGAILDGVDFYLVDLRGALFDAAYAEHLTRCGAILYDRCA